MSTTASRLRCLIAPLMRAVLGALAGAAALQAAAQSVDFGYTYSPANIVRVDFQTGARTNVFTFGGQITAATALAVDINNDVYMTSNQVAGPTLYRWNPVAPGTLANVGVVPGTLPIAAPNAFLFGRLAFDPAGTLFTLSNYTGAGQPTRPYLVQLNKTTAGISSAVLIPTATYGGPDLPVSGGDLCFAPNGRLFVSGSSANLPRIWEINPATGTILGMRTITGLTDQFNLAGCAFSIFGDFVGLHQRATNGAPYDLIRIFATNFSGASWTGTANLAVSIIEATGLPAFGDLGAPTTLAVIGRVFEDINYGGGVGRSQTTSSGVALANARVELYDSLGAFVIAQNTDTNGDYGFRTTPGTYSVRVANSTVRSSRTGGATCTTCVPVQTFRTDGVGTVTAVIDRVGGEAPQKDDAASNITSATLAALNTASAQAQSIASVSITTSNKTGVDFGFNFDTIVNTRDSGAGSLRQFIINANALGGEASLAQSGSRTNLTTNASSALQAGRETSIFMIPDGAAHPGMRAGLVNQLTAGVAIITPTTALLALAGANGTNTIIDGGTQTFNVGNTNAGTAGAGGTVGVDTLTLPTLQRPEVQIQDGASALATGLSVQANNTTLRGVSMFGFGTADVSLANALTGIVIESNMLGSAAAAFSDPGAANRSGSAIVSAGADGVIVQNNLIGFTSSSGMLLQSASNTWQILSNEIRSTALASGVQDAINLSGSGSATVQQNLIHTVGGIGIDMSATTGSNTARNNTVTNAGTLGAETAGIRADGATNTFDRNIATANAGAGIMVNNGATANTITRNSIFANGLSTGQIGIDLHSATDNAVLGTVPFVTLNDNGDGDAGANGLLNYPVLTRALIQGGNFTVEGFARPGAVIELFIAAPDASGFGEGQTFVTTLTEGSGADTDGTTGTYGPGAVNGIAQGTDTTNRFAFTFATPGGLAVGSRLTATATISGATSEFSGLVTVGTAVPVSGFAYLDANHNGTNDAGEAGTGQNLFVKLVARSGATCSGNATAVATVNITTGAYLINNVVTGDYCLILDNNSTVTDTTPNLPASWVATETPTRIRPISVVATALTLENFGLLSGSSIRGRVFRDTGDSVGGIANNATQDGAEQGIANISVRANHASCPSTLCDSTLTDGNGDYTLWIPAGVSGTITVTETNAPAFISTGGNAGTTGGTYVRATDTTTFTFAVGASYTGVNFADVPDASFTTDGAQNGPAGSTVVYPHSFTAGTAGTVSFSTASTPTPVLSGWANVIYRDANCNGVLEPVEAVSLSASVSVTAGQIVCILVKEFIPANAPNGAKDSIVVTANFSYVNAAPVLAANYTHSDVTTVGTPAAGGVQLVKDQALDGNCDGTPDAAYVQTSIAAVPGACIRYRITATNAGSTVLTNVVVSDATAAYTVYDDGSRNAIGAACGSGPVDAAAAMTVDGVPRPGITAPACGSAGSLRAPIGTLNPGQSGVITFGVFIANN